MRNDLVRTTDDGGLDLTPLAAAITGAFADAFWSHIGRWHKEGKVTSQEMEALEADLRDRGERLYEYIDAGEGRTAAHFIGALMRRNDDGEQSSGE